MEDVPEIDSPYHDLLILYAVGQLQFMDGDYADRPDRIADIRSVGNNMPSFVRNGK